MALKSDPPGLPPAYVAGPPGEHHPGIPGWTAQPGSDVLALYTSAVNQPGRRVNLARVDPEPLISVTLPDRLALPWTLTFIAAQAGNLVGTPLGIPAGITLRQMISSSLLRRVIHLTWGVGAVTEDVLLDYPIQGATLSVWASTIIVRSARGPNILVPTGYYEPQGGVFVAPFQRANRMQFTQTDPIPIFNNAGDDTGSTDLIPIPQRAYAYRIALDTYDPRNLPPPITIQSRQFNVVGGNVEVDRGPNPTAAVQGQLWDASWPGPTPMPLQAWANAIQLFSSWAGGAPPIPPTGYIQWFLDF